MNSLEECWKASPYPSIKLSRYFAAYEELFSHLRGEACTFIETGVLGGGSLFMWRSWLGGNARIIGVDLNPAALKWRDHGFEIFIGDQGDPNFWHHLFRREGIQFDALLDDGGHQAFQQIVTVNLALEHARRKCVVVVEDTHTSFMPEYAINHGERSFLSYAKACSDSLTARGHVMFPGRMKEMTNGASSELVKNVQSVQFFDSLVAFKVNPLAMLPTPVSQWNHQAEKPADFRYKGAREASLVWPDPYEKAQVTVRGG
jgi:hypothetical protein